VRARRSGSWCRRLRLRVGAAHRRAGQPPTARPARSRGPNALRHVRICRSPPNVCASREQSGPRRAEYASQFAPRRLSMDGPWAPSPQVCVPMGAVQESALPGETHERSSFTSQNFGTTPRGGLGGRRGLPLLASPHGCRLRSRLRRTHHPMHHLRRPSQPRAHRSDARGPGPPALDRGSRRPGRTLGADGLRSHPRLPARASRRLAHRRAAVRAASPLRTTRDFVPGASSPGRSFSNPRSRRSAPHEEVPCAGHLTGCGCSRSCC